jgi:hypothetical protein
MLRIELLKNGDNTEKGTVGGIISKISTVLGLA